MWSALFHRRRRATDRSISAGIMLGGFGLAGLPGAPRRFFRFASPLSRHCSLCPVLLHIARYQGEIKPTLEYSVDDFRRVMDINVVGMFAVLKAVGTAMKESGGGVICNTASVAGLRGTPAMVAYASSKAAVICMTVSTAKDLAPYNIRVNSISPALIGPGYMWDRQNELHAASGSPYFARDAETVASNKVAGVPLKRLGSIDEVVKSVAYLLSDDSSYSTATNLVVDGGLAGGIKA